MKDDELRARFEAWISLPPFEHSLERNEESSAWPWTYRLYVTEIAWEAWQACHATMQGEDVRRDASDAYDLIDRYLRNNMDDSDYAEYCAALDKVFAGWVAMGERHELS